MAIRSSAVHVDPLRVAALREFVGTSGNDDFTGTAAQDTADLSQGGADTFRGLAGDDYVYMGAALTARDRLVGGNGYDAIDLDGDYSAGLRLADATISGIDQILVYSGNSYRLTLADGNVAPLGRLDIMGNLLQAGDNLYVDGSAELDGDLIVYGGLGNDTIIGGAGNDLFRTGGGTDVITGGAGIDRISYAAAAAGITIDLTLDGTAQETGVGTLTLDGIEAISGSRYADDLTGDAGANQFFAGGGNDRINGAAGNDWLIVGAGYDGALPTDVVIDGGRGRDILDFFANSFDTAGVVFDLSLARAQSTGQGTFTVSGIENVAGTAFADILTGDEAANILYGNAAGDRLIGGNGADTLYGDGYLGIDRPSTTNDLPKVFEAPAGNDMLIGGAGGDTLVGGAGADTFAYQRLGDSRGNATDLITDFGRGSDVIDVSRIDANTARAGNQAFHLGETAGHTGDIVVRYNATNNVTTLAFHTDGDGVADMTIRLSGDHANLTNADFVF